MSGQTMTQKILAKSSGRARVEPGETVVAKIGMFSSLDATFYVEVFREKKLKVFDPKRVIFCFDHFFQPEWFPQVASKEHPKIRAFAREQGIPPENIYDLGRNGISHQIPVEDGWAMPGTITAGTDTQFATAGAANTLAIPLLGTTGAALLTGEMWIVVPEVVRVDLTGTLAKGVLGKDVGYRLLHDLSDIVNGRVIEFAGEGIQSLPLDVRMGICNCAVQMGALSMIFPFDDTLMNHLDQCARFPYEPVAADPDASYFAAYGYDLSTMDCLIAGPGEIDHIRPARELSGLPISAAYIGSCSSGRFEDLALAAEVLKGRKVHPRVRLAITPISAATMRKAEDAGLIKIFADAGAMVTQPGCGSCYSANLGPIKLGDGERCISSSVETVKGRMGSAEAEILLGNAALVAASAVAGEITHPNGLLMKTEIAGGAA
ncbi:aconitase [Stenotrophomonas sp. Nf1]|nr:aconitase [Stenotrophomonas sp. Nf1]PTA82447.1 aconitase [Stenotrophomonas sp. Nf4]